MSRKDEMIEAVWNLAHEVDSLPDEERDRLWPLVDRVAVLANAKAQVVSLAAVRDRTVHTVVPPSEMKTPDWQARSMPARRTSR